MSAPFDPTKTAAVKASFARWRAETVDLSPVRDLAGRSPLDAAAPPGCSTKNGALRVWAQFTRDAGMFRSGALLSGDFDRCLTLALVFAAPGGGRFAHDHAAALACCMGAFNGDLDRVWVEPPEPGLSPPRDVEQDRHLYRLFVGEDWRTPVAGTPPGPYLPWPQWRQRVDALAKPAGRPLGRRAGF